MAIRLPYPTDLLILDVLLEVRWFSSSEPHGQKDVHEAFSGLLRLANMCNCSAILAYDRSVL